MWQSDYSLALSLSLRDEDRVEREVELDNSQSPTKTAVFEQYNLTDE